MGVEGLRALSSDPGPVLLGAIEKSNVKATFFSFVALKPLLLGSYWADQVEKNMGLEGSTSPFQCPSTGCCRCYSFGGKIVKAKFFFSIVPFKAITRLLLVRSSQNKYGSRGRDEPFPMTLKKFLFPLFPLNRYNSAPTGQILIKKIWSCRARRALSNDPGAVFLCAIVSEKKIKKFLFPLFPLNRYNSAPIGQIFIKKICACRARRALSNDPSPVFLGAIVSEKKIKKFLFPLFPLNRYNSAPIGPILIKKIWACRARRALSNDPGAVFLCAIVSEKKIKKFLFPLFPLNRYNSAPIGQIFIKKIWACRARRALSNDPSPVFLGAIVSEKKLLKDNFFFPLFPLNRYNSAPVGQILIKKIWACRERRARSSWN
ncbi:LOW QUALITY PROTEIN: hypothetical protein V1477_006660 [Vespula maculifrons]|uniref:Uncharacterized protein n=1 Tax=Vespula maculifrons TaxID=7453 RepID=A0ABD2CJG0_VESMC